MSLSEIVIASMPEYINRIKNNYISLDNALDRKVTDYDKQWLDSVRYVISTKYIKVITGSSVHSFILLEDDKQFEAGDILKASSWNAPARNFARGNVRAPSTYESVSWTGA